MIRTALILILMNQPVSYYKYSIDAYVRLEAKAKTKTEVYIWSTRIHKTRNKLVDYLWKELTK